MGYVIRNIFMLTFLTVPFEAITVSPSLCPTNKIAPHKRITSWERPSSRTFGAFYDLLTPNSPQNNNQDTLQEEPQEDQPDDCGEIEDYDENDISTASQQTRRRQDRSENRFIFSNVFHKPPYHEIQRPTTPSYPITRPPRPQPPNNHYPPHRPPYWSGGLFSNNQYHPPSNENPTNNYKPVYESAHYTDVSQTYRPGVVGGPINHVVGVTQVRPTTTLSPVESTRKSLAYLSSLHQNPTPLTTYSNRRQRPRKLNDSSCLKIMFNFNGNLNILILVVLVIHIVADVGAGAFIFYWFYYADGTSVEAARKPLVIWIQGGPGLAASGIANFAEIGPLDMDMQPRNHTWVKGKNLLLIDHPVGTGFSYVTKSILLAKNDRDIATDLSKTIKAFFRIHKEFRKTPTYIFGQSYGGKICPRLAYYLYTAIEKKRLKMNLKGIGIGSGWVDPKESTLTYSNYLYDMGAIDRNTYLKINIITKRIAEYIEKKDYETANEWNFLLYSTINKESGMEINFNNINQVSPYSALDLLSKKVNQYVKPTLAMVNQSLEWSYISTEVFENLNGSFLIPSTKFLETLLNKTDLNIAIYNGNLDVITPLAGATNWVHKLRWHSAEQFKNAKRIQINGYRNGFYKKAKRLSFWWVFGSGHWVPEDNPVAMEQILDHVIFS
ncbi:unnamed protein product [Diatraea saccharalis]|uniref:Uncharacterized protein n=1 Tax=Diatraea saccharalis TaxID=40085 RepID=A0A9N9R0R7_9NEOP|nr:unnamed protein product [Diatraea saccharalis]